MRENIFERTSIAIGDAFIGRDAIVEELYQELTSEKEVHLSFNGLRRVGKSSIRQRIEERLMATADGSRLILFLSLDSYPSLFAFWNDIVRQIKDAVIDRDIKSINRLFATWEQVYEKKDLDSLNSTIMNMFAALKRQKIRVLLLLDEFDRAQKLFDKFDAQFELLRSLNTESGRFAVSTLLMHRRLLKTISLDVHNSSTFYEAFTKRPIGPFNDVDMEAYYNVFRNEFGYSLSESQKVDLQYYAGRIPYLLSNFGWYISEQLKAGKSDIDINQIYDEHMHEMVVQFNEDLIRLLKEDGLLTTAVKAVAGPQPDIDREGNELTQLIAMGYICPLPNNRYAAVSEKFYEVLYMQEIEDETWEALRQLETSLKRLVDSRLDRLFQLEPGQMYMDALREYLISVDPNNDGKYRKWMKTAVEMTGMNDIPLLRILSFGDLVHLVSDFFIEFRDVFNDLTMKEWTERITLCKNVRDMHAHHNEELLPSEYVNLVRIYCKEFTDKINTKLSF